MPLPTTTIATARLDLTPLVPADADAMVDVLADPAMYTFTGGEPPTVDGLRARYARLADGWSTDRTEQWLNWIVRPTGEQGPIGVLQATVTADDGTADVAWEIGVPWQGAGYAGEAAAAVVEWLVAHGIGTVRALVHPDHAASAAVARRAGLAATADREDGEVVWIRR